MKNYFIGWAYVFICFNLQNVVAQDSILKCSPTAYIEKYKDAAIADMKKYGVPASITLAQGLFESDCGNSDLAKIANNHFGIKCHKEWKGETFIQDDEMPNECFRKYPHAQASFDDHSDFLRSRDRYKTLFDLDVTDYKGWAKGLKAAGYATNPNYAERLIKLIETYQLYVYDGTTAIAGQPVTIDPITNNPSTNNPIANSQTSYNTFTTNQIINHNNIKATKVQRGDSWYKLAKQNKMELRDLLRYNDAQANDILKVDEIIYLAFKHRHADEEVHQVKKGDTLRSISQLYGVRLKRLMKFNKLPSNPILKEGDAIKLR
jgi:LysM repeat protein